MRRNDFFKYLLLGGGGSVSRSELESETLPYTFNSNSYKLRNYRIYGNTVDGESVGDLVTEGEHSGEYMVPVTVSNGTDTQTIPIYLTEQIRKVGDEAEYIDYDEQKQHRVRKNLLQNTAISKTINGVTFTVNADSSVTCNTDENGATATAILNIRAQKIALASNNYILSGCPIGGDIYAKYKLDVQVYGDGIESWLADSGNGVNISSDKTITVKLTRIVIYTGQVCNNLTFYPMIRKADISDDTYEPYIEDTELDITLPDLPTLSGTNTLSVGTTVQPSKIYLQGKISEVETVSAESVQTNVQSLQPLSLDNDDLQLDVMPTDNDLQIDVKPIEKPVLNLNDVSEIENAEIERGVENAE